MNHHVPICCKHVQTRCFRFYGSVRLLRSAPPYCLVLLQACLAQCGAGGRSMSSVGEILWWIVLN